MPTTFSMALPAIATITSPAKVSEIWSTFMVGSNDFTNQSETKAAHKLAVANNKTASQTGHRGGSAALTGEEVVSFLCFKDAGRYRTNKRSRTIETISEKVCS